METDGNNPLRMMIFQRVRDLPAAYPEYPKILLFQIGYLYCLRIMAEVCSIYVLLLKLMKRMNNPSGFGEIQVILREPGIAASDGL